jgi:chromosome segregation ATPase
MGKKEAYLEKREAQLRELEAEIEKLRAKADKAKADAKIKYYETIEDLQTRRDSYRQKLGELRDSSADAWEGFKVRVEGAWQELKNGAVGAMSKFK